MVTFNSTRQRRTQPVTPWPQEVMCSVTMKAYGQLIPQTSCCIDFYLWRSVKDKVHKTNSHTWTWRKYSRRNIHYRPSTTATSEPECGLMPHCMFTSTSGPFSTPSLNQYTCLKAYFVFLYCIHNGLVCRNSQNCLKYGNVLGGPDTKYGPYMFLKSHHCSVPWEPSPQLQTLFL